MSRFSILTPSGQVAAHLRGELARGRWQGDMPGVPTLAAELGVAPKTVGLALSQLEQEGLLKGRGQGRRREIVQTGGRARGGFRIALLLFEKLDMKCDYILSIRHELLEAGHIVNIAECTQCEMGHDAIRVKQLVLKTEDDAWIVPAGSRDVLVFFSVRKLPTFAIAGRSAGLDLAGITIKKSQAIRDGVRRLVELGRHRIVMLVREDRRKPFPGVQEQRFLQELTSCGINPGAYNLPDWRDSMEGFHHCLNALFQFTPPTALILDEPRLLIAALHHLAQRGLVAPRDISMFCLDPSPDLAWCDPAVAHVAWDPQRIVSQTVRWTENVAKGTENQRQTFIKARFVEGGTIGPVPK
jgi:DNA-binding LacI/PurR family transcriptional regulator